MAKTNFINGNPPLQRGTRVIAEFMNNIFLNGHKHDGVDADGHCSHIDLTTDVWGLLPARNIDEHNHTSSDITGFTTGQFGLQFNEFASGSQPVTVNWMTFRPSETFPKLVTLIFPFLQETAGSTTNLLDSDGTVLSTIPESLRPDTAFVYHPVNVINGGFSGNPGFCKIYQNGHVQFYRLVYSGSGIESNALFTPNAWKGWTQFSVTYPIYPVL